MQCRDHNGILYESKKDMCRKFGISEEAYNFRIKNGMSKKESLTLPIKHCVKVKDPSGEIYESIAAFCKTNKLKYNAFYRKYFIKGLPLEDILKDRRNYLKGENK